MAEAAEPTTTQYAGLAARVRQRQTWRPPALQMADTLFARMAGRTEPLRERVTRLSTWYGQLARRAQPRPGWSPLTLEPLADDTPGLPRASAPRATALGAGQAPLPSPPAAPPVQSRAPESGPSAHKAPPAMVQRTPQHAGSSAVQHVFPLVPRRPSVWLATLRDQPATAERLLFRPGGDSTMRTRLVLSTAAEPRREVRGGFPVEQAEVSATGGGRTPVGASSMTPSRRRGPSNSIEPQAGMNDGLASVSFPSPPSISGSPSAAVERLIERTVLPVPLPGLKLRLVSPEELTVAGQGRMAAEDTSRPATDGTVPTPVGSPPPLEIDINAVADRVYQTLERRQQLERERRGLYGCR